MKHIYEKNLLPVLKNIIDDIKPIENQCGWDYISKVLTYILEAGEEINKQEFVDTIRTGLATITEEKIMTLAEQFRQEGYQKGKAEGLTIAEQLKQEALKTVALKLFSQGLSVSQVAVVTGLSALDIEQLKNQSSH